MVHEAILVVDDEPAVAQVIRERLAQKGFQVRTAGSGEAALAAVAEEPLDLLILDLMLPDVDGFDVLRRLRQSGDDIPVVVLTARDDNVDVIVGLSLDLPADLPAVSGNADRLQQVVVNLVDNALRATPTGGLVLLRVTDGVEEVTLTVTDNGRGLTVEEAARAFEPYFRRPGGSAGLGLTIAREIVEAHGGCIWLKARPEGGAEAGFALPLVGQFAKSYSPTAPEILG